MFAFRRTNLVCATKLPRLSLFRRGYASPAANQAIILKQIGDECMEQPMRGLVVGLYCDVKDKKDIGILTPAGWRYNNERTGGQLLEVLRRSGPLPGVGQARLFFGLETNKVPYYVVTAICGLGKECLGYNSYEMIDEQKEAIRRSCAKAVRMLLDCELARIDVEGLGNTESAAEGAFLGLWMYQEYRRAEQRTFIPIVDLFTFPDEICDTEGFLIGKRKASAQNMTRLMQEMPPNKLTPTIFAQTAVDVLCKSGVNIEVKVEGWARSQMMNSFLAVGKASCEQPLFLELSYFGTNANERPAVLVGQGVTYDTGGMCLKEFDELKDMRGDMLGAALVVAVFKTISAMRLKINMRGLIPLCENMLGCNAFRPGDIYRTMNGKSIQIQGTDHEDMLVLGDTLLYAQNFCPKFILDVGCTSGAMRNALGEGACGVFTNSEILWQQLRHAAMHTGDRVWRMPLWDYYTELIQQSKSADIQNYGTGRGGRPCKAAAFLREFVPCGQWAHIDATGVMTTTGIQFEYLREGMSGRPTRTIVEFLAGSICFEDAPKAKKSKSK